MKRRCPNCKRTRTQKNGHTHNGKQNHYCHECGRQFVSNPEQILISLAQKEQIRKLLLERIPYGDLQSGRRESLLAAGFDGGSL